MSDFIRDETHWLRRLSPDEWIAAALGELSRAETAWTSGSARAGVVGLKRAAGMALNGALLVEPDDAWGRSYVEHVEALSRDEKASPRRCAPLAARSSRRGRRRATSACERRARTSPSSRRRAMSWRMRGQ